MPRFPPPRQSTEEIIMAKTTITATAVATATTNPTALNVQFPVYIRVDESDTSSIEYHKGKGTPLAKFALRPGLPKHLYAVMSAKSQAEADTLNREIGNMDRKASRDQAKQSQHETSMTPFDEAGIDLSTGYVDPDRHFLPDISRCKENDPSEIVAYGTVLNALIQEYNELSEDKQAMCRMIADKTPERTVADELGIRQSTLNGRKNAMLKELNNKMKDFK